MNASDEYQFARFAPTRVGYCIDEGADNSYSASMIEGPDKCSNSLSASSSLEEVGRFNKLVRMHIQRFQFCQRQSANTRKELKKLKILKKRLKRKQNNHTYNEIIQSGLDISNMPYLPTTFERGKKMPKPNSKQTNTFLLANRNQDDCTIRDIAREDAIDVSNMPYLCPNYYRAVQDPGDDQDSISGSEVSSHRYRSPSVDFFNDANDNHSSERKQSLHFSSLSKPSVPMDYESHESHLRSSPPKHVFDDTHANRTYEQNLSVVSVQSMKSTQMDHEEKKLLDPRFCRSVMGPKYYRPHIRTDDLPQAEDRDTCHRRVSLNSTLTDAEAAAAEKHLQQCVPKLHIHIMKGIEHSFHSMSSYDMNEQLFAQSACDEFTDF